MVYNSVLYKVQIHSLGMAWTVAQQVKTEHQVSFLRFDLDCALVPVRVREPGFRKAGVLVSAVFGAVHDPVHDDETHAANHHYDSTCQE